MKMAMRRMINRLVSIERSLLWLEEAQRTLANPTEQATWLTGSGSVWLYPLDRIDIQVFNLNRLVAGVDRHYTAIGLAMEVA